MHVLTLYWISAWHCMGEARHATSQMGNSTAQATQGLVNKDKDRVHLAHWWWSSEDFLVPNIYMYQTLFWYYCT